MTTFHRARFHTAADCSGISDRSVDLIVTSPPYPMIEMWDQTFAAQEPRLGDPSATADGSASFQLMHAVLDAVWRQCARLVKPGGYVCINIGDATRSVEGNFRLYTNHSRITTAMEDLGFQSLPPVLWRKQTNGPNKFMGSGMLPSGAYVTLEHEYILIFRLGGKRAFGPHDKDRRRRSAFFWEERNTWFSDVWDFKGVRQNLSPGDARDRSGAFPFELAFRLINMYSMQEDVVFDPFLGTGTTMIAAMAAGRSSIGVEIDSAFASTIDDLVFDSPDLMNRRQADRLRTHRQFVDERVAAKGEELKHVNSPHGFPVVTAQESDMRLPAVARITRSKPGEYAVDHARCTEDSDASSSPVELRGFDRSPPGGAQLDLGLSG